MGLANLLTPQSIRWRIRASSWQEAVKVTGQLMVELGICEPRYVTAMQDLIEREGPYLVIAPGIALLHARPEDGVLRPGMALLTLANPVEFGHSANDPVWLLVGLAAAHDGAHVHALAEIAEVLSDTDAVTALKAAQSAAEMVEIINRVSANAATSTEEGAR